MSVALFRVHPEWHRTGREFLTRARPRILQPTTFENCLPLLFSFTGLQSLELPPLSDSSIFFSHVVFSQLKALTLRQLYLEEGRSSLILLSNLRELSIERAVVNSRLLYSISHLKHLVCLRLTDVTPTNGVLLNHLSVLPRDKLEHLTIVDSPQLTNDTFQSLPTMGHLRYLKLGVTSLNADQRAYLEKVQADISLEICSPGHLGTYHSLAANRNIVSLKFSDFGNQCVPAFLSNMSLDALAFTKGYVSLEAKDANVVFPTTLTALSISLTEEHYTMLDRLIQNPEGLRSLALVLSAVLPTINFSRYINLDCLKVFGIRFDGNALKKVATLKHLKFLQIGGCMSLEESHVSHLSVLPHLTSLVICSSTPTNNAYVVMAQLKQLKNLEFHRCHALCPWHLPEMRHLTRMQFGHCINVEHNLEKLLARDDIKSLSFLGLKLASHNNNHLSNALQESGIQERDVIVDTDILLPSLDH